MRSDIESESSESDAVLVDRVRAGQRGSFGELYRRHYGAALSLASFLCGDQALAGDFASEAFTRVLRIVSERGGSIAEFRPYLLRSVRNVAYEHFRKHGRVALVDKVPEPADGAEDASFDVLREADRHLIAAAFRALPLRSQRALWLSHVVGLNNHEIAARMRTSPGAVAGLTYRARESLRREYLRAHTAGAAAACEVADCANVRKDLGEYLRTSLPGGRRVRTEAHLASCASCTDILSDLREVDSSFRADSLVPLCFVLLSAKAAHHIAAGTWWGALKGSAAAKTLAAVNATAMITACVVGIELSQRPSEQQAGVGTDPGQAAEPGIIDSRNGEEALGPATVRPQPVSPASSRPEVVTAPQPTHRRPEPIQSSAWTNPVASAVAPAKSKDDPPVGTGDRPREETEPDTPALSPPLPRRDDIAVASVDSRSPHRLAWHIRGTTVDPDAEVRVRVTVQAGSFFVPGPASSCRGLGQMSYCTFPADQGAVDETVTLALGRISHTPYTVTFLVFVNDRQTHAGEIQIRPERG